MEIEGFCVVINFLTSTESRGKWGLESLSVYLYSVELFHKCTWLSFPLLLFLADMTIYTTANNPFSFRAPPSWSPSLLFLLA